MHSNEMNNVFLISQDFNKYRAIQNAREIFKHVVVTISFSATVVQLGQMYGVYGTEKQ